MKIKILSILTAIVAAMSLCFGFAACAQETENNPPPVSGAEDENKKPDDGEQSGDNTGDNTNDNNNPDGDTSGDDDNNKEVSWEDDGVLKILMIGNSFSIDAISYGYEVAKSLGVNKVYLGCLYIGGCSIATHAANAKNDIEGYEYHINSAGTWRMTPRYTIKNALKAQDWDFVTMQQVSTLSGQADSLRDLDYLIGYVKENVKDSSHTKLVWHSTWAYSTESRDGTFVNEYNSNQITMYNRIIDVVKKVIIPKEDIYAVIPNGTAIQNARAALNNNLCRDELHLSLGIGRYIAALTLISRLTGLDVSNIEYAPLSVSAAEKQVAIESVKNALANPYELTT